MRTQYSLIIFLFERSNINRGRKLAYLEEKLHRKRDDTIKKKINVAERL